MSMTFQWDFEQSNRELCLNTHTFPNELLVFSKSRSIGKATLRSRTTYSIVLDDGMDLSDDSFVIHPIFESVKRSVPDDTRVVLLGINLEEKHPIV